MIEELLAKEIDEKFKKLADTKISDLLSSMRDKSSSHPEMQECKIKMMCAGGLHPTEDDKCLLVIVCNDPLTVSMMKSLFELASSEMEKMPELYSAQLRLEM